MLITVGKRLYSQVCETAVIVVRAPRGDINLCCGGQPMTPTRSELAACDNPGGEFFGGTKIGKRYGDDALQLELLVTRGGTGTLTVGDVVIAERAPKKLPSSD